MSVLIANVIDRKDHDVPGVEGDNILAFAVAHLHLAVQEATIPRPVRRVFGIPASRCAGSSGSGLGGEGEGVMQKSTLACAERRECERHITHSSNEKYSMRAPTAKISLSCAPA